jgi:hypothetical protein
VSGTTARDSLCDDLWALVAQRHPDKLCQFQRTEREQRYTEEGRQVMEMRHDEVLVVDVNVDPHINPLSADPAPCIPA